MEVKMKRLTTLLNRYLTCQETFCKWMLILLGVIMTILILLQIFFRFVIYIPFPWSEECARYLMIWMGMLGSVAALQRGRHIGVTFLMEKLPALPRQGAALLVQLLMIGFLSVLLWQGIEFAMFNQEQLSPAMELSMLVPYGSVPVGAAMMILVIIGEILNTFFPADTALDCA